MSKELLEVLVPLLIGPPVGIITIRYFFKGSILFRITAYWVITLSILDALANMSSSYPEIMPMYLAILVGLPIFFYFFYRTAKEVRKPLDDAVNALQKLADGNLNIEVDKSFLDRNDELGRLTSSIQNLSSKLKEVIESISDSATEINSTGVQLSSHSQQLSQSANEQASSLEEISSTMEQIVSSIQQNAHNSQQTEIIAIKANQSLEEGTK